MCLLGRLPVNVSRVKHSDSQELEAKDGKVRLTRRARAKGLSTLEVEDAMLECVALKPVAVYRQASGLTGMQGYARIRSCNIANSREVGHSAKI